MYNIKELLYRTAHRNRKSLKQLADETGISENYLYRACMPLDQSGVKFPVENLIPLMKAAEDFSILSHLANLCGFILVKIPRFKAKRGESIDIYDDYQKASAVALNALKIFFSDPSKANKDSVDEALMKVLEESQTAKKYCDKFYGSTPELF
ncbi:MAG: hypothetical protein LC102_09170 [Ignavibacteriales bacterium]|jgi:hypothetical protein|nr:MAG: hypothetical protein F9K26_05460 [Ignavibacteriaceae bacterium]MBW7872865.1 hypothetical protein [Ignavibacteria bacterium]MCZ2143585.1 hypothetical protein [Ignavibacteriales bacterium]MBV6444460.1 hypothetical protein [Ignavibacteriaceae bacterium]MBZ0197265.1 hypothetical protein [Ignavibacteriaceae bacterium]